MALHQLYFEQFVPASLDRAWDFFSSPANLKEITPPEMGFDITTPNLPPKMYPGMIIAYKVRPLLRIPTTWVTEITQVKEKEYFVDDQRVGPYSIWNHRHTFEERDGGVLMTDRINYVVPLGPLGNILNAVLIRRRIESIFTYRTRRIEEIFGPDPRPPERAGGS
jgi:ligand-binding SRPBCC domain-containing protein